MATVESVPNDSKALLVPFQIDPQSGGIATVTGETLILRQQMVGVLMTNHYERVMNTSFGANVQSKLFDVIDVIASSDAANAIRESLSAISPLLAIQDVRFYQDPQEQSGVILEVQYSIANQASLLKVRFLNGIITDQDKIV